MVEVIKTEGVGLADEAVAKFRSDGGTPADARAIVEAYRGGLEPKPPAWSAAALYYRLTHWLPGQDPRDGWPSPDDGHTAARDRLADEQRRRNADREAMRLRERRKLQRASRRDEQEKLAKLEAAARALPDREYQALLGSISDPFIRRLARREPYGVAALTAIADRLGVESLDATDSVPTGSRGPPSLN